MKLSKGRGSRETSTEQVLVLIVHKLVNGWTEKISTFQKWLESIRKQTYRHLVQSHMQTSCGEGSPPTNFHGSNADSLPLSRSSVLYRSLLSQLTSHKILGALFRKILVHVCWSHCKSQSLITRELPLCSEWLPPAETTLLEHWAVPRLSLRCV